MGNDKSEILDLVRAYHHATASSGFVPGVTPVPASGAVLSADDRVALVDAALDLRIAAGVGSRELERSLAAYLGLRRAHLTSSGSSANLLALGSLTSPQLGGDRLQPGDEVVTVAGFPTTVDPIVQNGLVPVFVDIELGTYNASPRLVEQAIGPRTRAVMMAHALGNPFQVREIADLCTERGLFLIEDNCDALGSRYQGRLTGTFGDLATESFHPDHHVSMGEGGCVLTDNLILARIVESCLSPVGHRPRSTDISAALGLQQLSRIDDFGAARRHNWRRLREGVDGLPHLILPAATPGSDPSWSGFALTVHPGAPFAPGALIDYLETRGVATRRFFAGNLLRHAAYSDIGHRVSGTLTNSDIATERTFWIGVYPGLTDEMIDHSINTVSEYVTLPY